MPLQRCKKDGKSGWKYGDNGACYTGPGAKKKAIRQGVAIQENGGPEFESRKKAKSGLTDEQLDARVSQLISREEAFRDDLEREMMDRAAKSAD